MATRQDQKDAARRRRAERERAAAAAEQRRDRRRYGFAALLAAATVAAIIAVIAAGGEGEDKGAAGAGEPQAGHVHGLGVDPRGGALFIATHTGLFRAPAGGTSVQGVSESDQDIMGFTVAGPDRLLGSGHPGPDQGNLPGNLGLIESRDGGRTWQPISLLGEADFHVLRAAGDRVYGYDGANARFMASADGGRSFSEREVPGPLVDLAIDPDDPERLVGSTESGLIGSTDAGRSWRPLGREVALLAWGRADRLFLLNAEGQVKVSEDGGRRFADSGRIEGQPVALMGHEGDLYVALADGRVQRSTDGGRSWTVRAQL